MRLLSPAKINLRLKVEGRRKDGFHLLSMLNILCDFYDEITLKFQSSPGINIVIEPEGKLPVDNRNLAYRAAEVFYQEFPVSGGVSINLKKNIPLGGGLGGGSGNAAIVLMGLTRHYSKELSQKLSLDEKSIQSKVKEIAARLGSDVPYFLCGKAARVSGIGDIVEVLDLGFLEELKFLLLLPEESISTADVYSELRKIDSRSFKNDELIKTIKDYKDLLNAVDNDLQQISAGSSKAVTEVLRRLNGHKDYKASMSGSGTSMFVLRRDSPAIQPQDRASVQQLLSGIPIAVMEVRYINSQTRLDLFQ